MLKETKSHCAKTSKPGRLDSFNVYLQLPTNELIWEIGGAVHLSPGEIDFLINPRRLRGSDFLMRWAQGRWSEEIVIRALNQTKEFGIIPQQWEAHFGIPVYVVHIFYDRGYFIRFNDVLGMLESGELGMEVQRYTNPDGTAASPKSIVKVPYILCKEFGTVSGQTLLPRTFVDKNGGGIHLKSSPASWITCLSSIRWLYQTNLDKE